MSFLGNHACCIQFFSCCATTQAANDLLGILNRMKQDLTPLEYDGFIAGELLPSFRAAAAASADAPGTLLDLVEKLAAGGAVTASQNASLMVAVRGQAVQRSLAAAAAGAMVGASTTTTFCHVRLACGVSKRVWYLHVFIISQNWGFLRIPNQC